MRLSTVSTLSLLVISSPLALAVRFQVEGRRSLPEASFPSLARRGNVAGSSPLNDSADISYVTNITLGGSSFSVLIDTGRCALVLHPHHLRQY